MTGGEEMRGEKRGDERTGQHTHREQDRMRRQEERTGGKDSMGLTENEMRCEEMSRDDCR